MISRRDFLKASGLTLGGVTASSALTGCDMREKKTKLANGYVARGHTYHSPTDALHYNFEAREVGLTEKSYLDGTVINISEVTIGDRLDRRVQGIEVTMQPQDQSIGEYVLQIWRGSIPLDKVKQELTVGKKISIPTLRQYDRPANLYKII